MIRPAHAVIALLLLMLYVKAGGAAEVDCVARYGPAPEGIGEVSDEIARKLWPSGFRPTIGMCESGYIRGKIEKGDYEKIRIFYKQNHRVLNVFSLSSPGGDVVEGIRIGRLFRKFLISALAPSRSHLFTGTSQWYLSSGRGSLLCQGPECFCASACALIWFGAVDRLGTVGLHRPRIDDPEFTAMAPGGATKVYRQVLDQIANYLDEMAAPRPLIDAMVATNSSDIRWVDADVDHLENPPSYVEWRQAACGQFNPQERETMENLERKTEPLPDNERLLLRLLSEKEMKTRQCTMALRYSHVERMSLP
jgi:hypothetical protein